MIKQAFTDFKTFTVLEVKVREPIAKLFQQKRILENKNRLAIQFV